MSTLCKHITITVLLSIGVLMCYAQECKQAFVSGFSNHTTSSVLIKWIDFSNDAPLGYEIELGYKGFMRTGVATTSLIDATEYNYIGLESGTTYEFWLRTVCSDSNSEWNGPFNFNTTMTNPSQCMINLAIDNDNCPSTNKFRIDVKNYPGAKLGVDYILDRIDLIIEHPWPPDLSIALRSPGGVLVPLSQHNGIGSENYGDLSNELCNSPASFTSDACENIEIVNPPYIGSFRPEGDLNSFLDGSNVNGTWIIEICDRAKGDLGFLRYSGLSFTEESCPLPFITVVNDVAGDQVTLRWEQSLNCDGLQLEVGPVGFLPGTQPTIFINCDLEQYLIEDLLPDTEYEYYVRSVCGPNTSAYSCPFIFRTSCAQVSTSSSFDDQDICPSNCNQSCNIHGIWKNSIDDDHDWIVFNDATPTTFTGPDKDYYNFGNFIYIENLSEFCSQGATAVLQSECLLIQSTEANCAMQFGYHMSGVDITELKLEISIDDGDTWVQLWIASGDQGDTWNTAFIDLNAYDGRIAMLRFSAKSGANIFGDIGLDQIDFFGTLVNEEISYYFDNDLDGFGDPLNAITKCSDIVPFSYATNNKDCDDHNEFINPVATEIPCNLVDENCNGIMDDAVEVNPIQYTVSSKTNESCRGANDGSVLLDISGGQGPYQVNWNNGISGNPIQGLAEGIYFGEIQDVNGCLIAIQFIEIDAEFGLNVFLLNKTNNTCDGINNGAITVAASGGIAPYEYIWSNGMTGTTISNLAPGNYHLVVADALGCESDTITYDIVSKPKIVAGVQDLRNVRCSGGNNGSILLGANNGAPPYLYNWSTGQTTAQISNLTAGFYSCTISDQNGCFNVLKDINIKEPSPAEILIDNIQQISCAGEMDGSIEISTRGGNPPYTFRWNNGKLTDDLFALSPGYYSVTATDSRACEVIRDSVEISVPDPIVISIDSIGHVECPLSTDGFIEANVTGGSGNYFYFWSVNESPDTSYLDSISPGKYSLTIIDQFNCKSSKNQIEVSALNEAIPINITLLNANICPKDSIASISANANSGNLPMSYNWSAGQENISILYHDTLDLIPSGMYNVTVTDNEGCTGVSNMVEVPMVNNFDFVIQDLITNTCYGDSLGKISLQVFGGIAPLDILWNNGSQEFTIDSLANGNYAATITDDRLCEIQTQNIKITSPSALAANVTIQNQSPNELNGSIQVTMQGGVPNYDISWENHAEWDGLFFLENLSAGTYTFQVTDDNGCILTGDVLVDLNNSVPGMGLHSLLQIFPNPTKDQIYIKAPLVEFDLSSLKIHFLSIYGDKMVVPYSHSFIEDGMVLIHCPLTSLPTGIYNVVIETKTTRYIDRVVVLD